MPITNIPISGELGNIGRIAEQTQDVAAPGFADQLKTFIKDVNSEIQHSEKISEDFAQGKINNIHEVMVATEKAAIAFRLAGSVRERVIEAYHEVMRLSV